MKNLTRIAAALIALAVAVPALPCGLMHESTTTTTSASPAATPAPQAQAKAQPQKVAKKTADAKKAPAVAKN